MTVADHESERMRRIAAANLAEIEALYLLRETSGLDREPDSCAAVVQRVLSLGEPLLAYDFCMFGLQHNAGHLRLRQLLGLALARSGAHVQACEQLEALYAEGQRDEETIGILARVYKDRWSAAPTSGEGKASLRRAHELYAEAYRLTGGYWTGINAATTAAVLGQTAAAKELASRVRSECLMAAKKSAQPVVWLCATLGEAALLLGDVDDARSWYEKAIAAGSGQADRASMRRNIGMIVATSGLVIPWLAQVLPPPVVGVFAGHRIDADDRTAARFPEPMAAAVEKALAAQLESADVQIGFASAASGGDILFHEAMLNLGRETHVVLPEPPDTFASRSLPGERSNWRDRFERILKHAASVVVHSNAVSGRIGYAYNNWMMLGLARSKAKQLGGRVTAFALWDGNEGALGGTSNAVRDWQAFGETIECLAPMAAPAPVWRSLPGRSGAGDIARSIGSQRIVSILFADVAGFSKVSDDSIPSFFEHFLGMVARVVRRHEAPLVRNTWGDGLYFCFATPRGAGLFALDLCDEVRKIDWSAFGLPPLSIRVALHCGPTHAVFDPVIEQRSFSGAHVSRAARIEPVTPPGSVYSSQPFAALCECEGVDDFTCEYVGRTPLAKKFGVYPLFCVHRTA